MMFSKTCTYAIKVMIYIATHERGVPVGLDEIAGEIGSPKAFTAKVLQQLTRAKLLESIRGPHGGFFLQDNKDITIGDIVSAIDGDVLFDGCVLGFEECSTEHPCPVHHKFVGVRDLLVATLGSTTLKELQAVMDSGAARLKG